MVFGEKTKALSKKKKAIKISADLQAIVDELLQKNGPKTKEKLERTETKGSSNNIKGDGSSNQISSNVDQSVSNDGIVQLSNVEEKESNTLPEQSNDKVTKNATKKKVVVPVTKEDREERNAKSLFIDKLPKNVKKKEVQMLSRDIISVYMPKRRVHPIKYKCAFLEFASEEKAEKNYKLLQRKTVRGQRFTVDFTGAKRQKKDKNEDEEERKRLFIENLPKDIKQDELNSLTPDIIAIHVSKRSDCKCAIVVFESEEIAEKNLEILRKKFRGRPIAVNFFGVKGQKEEKQYGRRKDWMNDDQQRKTEKMFAIDTSDPFLEGGPPTKKAKRKVAENDD